MAEFNGQFITNKGRNLLNRALAGEGKIIFTGAALGVGKHTGNLKEITELQNKKLEMNVLSVRNDNGSAVLKLFVTNEKVTESFTTQEFGVYAKIEGDREPILYSYATAIEPDTIPSNRFGTTYEAINEIYMSFVSDIDTDIQVTHGNIFLTMDVATETFIKHGYVLGGKLKEQTQLMENRVYNTDIYEYYLNTETRSWNRTEVIDNKLIKLDLKNLINFAKKTFENNLLNKQEIQDLLGFNALNQEFILATLDDIKNLFPGSGGTSGTFDLGHISSDSTKIVNMMLLSNYNEYLQQKILEIKSFFNNLNNEKADKTALSNYYTKQEIDSKVDTLESNKADKTALNEFYKKNVTYTKTEVDEMLNNKADSETVTTNLNDKANKTIQIIVGDGLLGTGTLESNINITVDNLSDEEIQSLMTNWR